MFARDERGGHSAPALHGGSYTGHAWRWQLQGVGAHTWSVSPWEPLYNNITIDLSERLRNAKIDALIAKINKVRLK